MIIITISDIHGSLQMTEKVANVLEKADLLIIAGDITNFGNEDVTCHIISTLKEHIRNIFAVYGNCDSVAIARWLDGEKLSIVDCVRNFKGVEFFGIGGTMSPYYSPEDIGRECSELKNIRSPWVFVTHQPPYGTGIDSVSGSHHVGSPVFNEIIKNFNPILSFSGHVHESPGVDKLGNTIIANPGPFAKGGYIYTDLDVKRSHIKCCQLRYF